MGNDIEIRVRVAHQTAGGLAAVNSSVNGLKQNATAAAHALRTLDTRSTAAGQSLRQMENRAQSATLALRSLRSAGNIRIAARLDDRVSSGVASIKSGLRDLKRESPVRLTATFHGQAGQITAAATAMRDLRSDARGADTALGSLTTRSAAAAASLNSLEQQAEDASRALRTLRGRAAAAAVAMGDLRTQVAGAANALRSFNIRAQTADGRLSDLSDRTRTLRSDSDDLDASMRSLTGTLAGLRGHLGTLRTSSGGAGGGMQRLRSAALLLSPALIPIAAAAVPVAANLAAAGIAVGVFGLAIGAQVAKLAQASEAEKKYKDAVKEHGKASEQAVKAELAFLRTVKDMDPATRRAAAALSVFKDQYRAWSNSLAGDTMPVVTKSFAVFGGLLPRLSPLVRTTSGELDRLMTVLAGGVNSSGFERLMDTFAQFAGGALSKATDGLVRFMRTMSGGGGSSQFSEFMAYVREVGPQVAETLGNLSQALAHIVVAASDVGVGILTAVNAFAQLVNAIPDDVLSTLIQFVVVFKAVKLAAVGLGGAAGGVAAFGTSLAALRAASAGAGGGLAGVAAAFGTLSRAAKASVIAAGIGLLVVAVSKLGNLGREAPPNVDRLTTSLGKLGNSGRASGESARLFGDDLDGLYDSIKSVSDPALVDHIQQGLVKVFTLGFKDSTPVKEAKERINAIDDALTNLVKGGKAEQAAEAFDLLKKKYAEGGGDVSDLKKKLENYHSALEDQAFEAELAAQSMGLFGAEAQKVQAKLDGQKRSADGLRQSLQALNDVQRGASGAMNAFEQSIDDVAKAAKENGGALRMVDGHLDLNSKKARDAEGALRGLAQNTEAAAAAAREAGEPWSRVNAIYSRGKGEFVKAAQALGLTESQARSLRKAMLRIPDSKKMKIEMRTEDAVAGLTSVIAAMRKTPKSKSVTVKALTSDAIRVLESLGLKVTRMKDGSFRVTAKTGAAHSSLRGVQRARDGLKNKTIAIEAATGAFHAAVRGMIGRTLGTSYVNVVYRKNPAVGAALLGGMRAFGASGGLVGALPQKRFATGGDVQAFPNGGSIRGPGSSTSDSILAMFPSGATARVSDSEYVVQARAVKKYGTRFLDALNDGRLAVPGLRRGGLTKAQRAARARQAKERAREAARVQREARNTLWDQFGISHFGRKAGYQRDPFEKALGAPSDLGSLVSSLNQARGNIKRATTGGTERRLLRALDSAGRGLIRHEKALSKVNGALDKAKDKLNDLRSSASSLRESVRSNVLSAANITRGGGSDKAVTTGSIMSGLIASRDKATAFSGALSTLKKRGLDKGLLKDIAEAGIEGGGLETAGALLRASGSEIKSMNSLQAQIAKSALASGKSAADAFYGAAIKAQERLVKGLQKQQDKLEKAMARLAKALEKTIARGIRGRKASGGIVGAAASGGIRSGLTWVGEHEPELLDLPVGSRVRSGPDSRRLAAASAMPSSQPLVIQLNIGGREFGQLWIDTGRREVRTRGGSVQAALMGA
ncbi:phage tail protein [Streptomyces lasiicapitis]|uniref:phage tail protein n=1 Tax=Streptomyces lasiicapitis TaxID=1923961 RepID=UPI00364FFEF5